MIGLDAFGWGRFLNAASRTASAGPAIHLPIFDGGALRAQLKGRYAEFDFTVANYNETLVNALTDVATQLADIRSIDTQIVNAVRTDTAAQRALTLALAMRSACPTICRPTWFRVAPISWPRAGAWTRRCMTSRSPRPSSIRTST